MYKILIYFLLFSLTSASHAQSINEQIEAIKSAQPKERVAMMNRLKLQIAAMNEEQRMQAINTLQRSKGMKQTNMQSRMHQVHINKGRNSIGQVKNLNNMPAGSRGQGKK